MKAGSLILLLWWVIALLVGIIALTALIGTGKARAACHPIKVTWYSPTGVAGCEVYGVGIASWYAGPGVARNDCSWPWTRCTPITITAISTGRSITVRPTMFCDCYTGTGDERLVDLDPASLRALGLDPSQGLYPVRVRPTSTASSLMPTVRSMPDTAMSR